MAIMMGSIVAGRQTGLVLEPQLRAHISLKNGPSTASYDWRRAQGLVPLSAELSPTDGFGER